MNKLTKIWYRKASKLQATLDALEPEVEIAPLSSWEPGNLWDDCEMFGFRVDDQQLESLCGFYRDPDTGSLHGSYYFPDDDGDLVEIPTIDRPNRDGVAWDALPISGVGRSLPTIP